jgi:hypothetical protein
LLEEIKGRSLTKEEIEILTNQEIEVLRQLIGSSEALRTLADLQNKNPSAFEAWVKVYNLGVGAARLGGFIAFVASGLRRILIWIVATIAVVIAMKNGGFGTADLFKYLGLMK